MTQPDEDRLLLDGPIERDIEAPEADAADQALPADPVDAPPAVLRDRPYDVSEYDLVEQDRIVDLNDEY